MKNIVMFLVTLYLFQACEERDLDYATKEIEDRQAYLKAEGISEDTKTVEGIYFIPEKTTEGRGVLEGRIARIKYTLWLINGKRVVKAQNYTVKVGQIEPENNRNAIEGLNIALKKMRQGEKAKVVIPSELAYGELAYGNIPAYSTLIFDIEVISADLEADEQDAITDYILNKDTDLVRDDEKGIYFKKTLTVDDEELTLPKDGETVTVKYEGYFLTGNPFERNQKGAEVTIAAKKFVEGFESAVAKLKKGEKCKVLIPSEKAYGERSSSLIPAYTPIIFDIERTK